MTEVEQFISDMLNMLMKQSSMEKETTVDLTAIKNIPSILVDKNSLWDGPKFKITKEQWKELKGIREERISDWWPKCDYDLREFPLHSMDTNFLFNTIVSTYQRICKEFPNPSCDEGKTCLNLFLNEFGKREDITEAQWQKVKQIIAVAREKF